MALLGLLVAVPVEPLEPRELEDTLVLLAPEPLLELLLCHLDEDVQLEVDLLRVLVSITLMVIGREKIYLVDGENLNLLAGGGSSDGALDGRRSDGLVSSVSEQ